jgi:hypothetical protein
MENVKGGHKACEGGTPDGPYRKITLDPRGRDAQWRVLPMETVLQSIAYLRIGEISLQTGLAS